MFAIKYINWQNNLINVHNQEIGFVILQNLQKPEVPCEK